MPFVERGGRLRGVLDLVTGCYPGYLFGGGIGRQLPVFHLHEATVEFLEPRLRHLAENGYRTLSADDVAAYVRAGAALPDRAVVLTFDDARASLWTVAAPLLRRYGLHAITFAIPARVTDATAVRPTINDGRAPADAAADDTSAVPFATWPELRALAASGTLEVHSHTRTHASIFCSDTVVDFITPTFASEHILDHPLVSALHAPVFLGPAALGAPLFVRRSRMSDARRFVLSPSLVDDMTGFVADQGGAAFFERPDWRQTLTARMPSSAGTYEPESQRRLDIADELSAGRDLLDERLGDGTARHVALPWGVAGRDTLRVLPASGYQTAYAEDLFRRRTVRTGDNPYQLMRLNGRFILCLPGTGRQYFFSQSVQ